ncbi:PhnD/SsuA/transferrin family substrate-binding protein [Sodalis sp. dw_96]|uniref:phosphate/phosphite/phosphonate ABC transporter substrate-binding protein n=1 Tax=Sodalis sp. dw_96 TaxID=2719794 RepID=UPI001BD600AF|nr:PhnD/SsuA/transferrin family substrate-binding protein [Sodalis sp. dw_96]
MGPTDIVSLPMYAVNRADVDAQWQQLRLLLAEQGLPVADLSLQWPEDLVDHWRDPRLLLSQTCGYPLMNLLPNVQPVGCFHYDAPGCEGIGYRSLILARRREKGSTLGDFRQRRAVSNGADSYSGYHALEGMVKPLMGGGAFFSEVIFSGGHEQSLLALQREEADIAAVDCVTYALLQRHRPERIRGLKVIGQTPLCPGLPLITQQHTPPATLAALRTALLSLASKPEYRAVCRAVLITGFSPVSRKRYDVIPQGPGGGM